MSENKKYFWMRLKENFFDSEEMKILESQKNSAEYQILYFKLCLLSLKNEGRIAFKNLIPYDLNMLSTILRVNIDTVKTGLEMFNKLGLVDMLDTGVIFMTDIQSLIGRSSSEADRIRKYREKIENEKQGQIESVQMYEKCTPELEIELKKEIEIYKKKPKQQRFMKPTVDEVRGYLKERGITSFKADAFIDYYESKGWMIGKNPMKDWRAAVRTWERNANEKTPMSKPVIDLPVEKRDWYVPEEERVDPAEVEGLLAAIGIRR
jgi:predicted phage replisome organizer